MENPTMNWKGMEVGVELTPNSSLLIKREGGGGILGLHTHNNAKSQSYVAWTYITRTPPAGPLPWWWLHLIATYALHVGFL